MLAYPLTGPSSETGLYIIKNRNTGHVYVGQSVDLRRRYQEWRTVFASGLGATNRALEEIIESTNIEDWDFYVFQTCEKHELNRLEDETITKVRAQIGDKCINGTEPKVPRKVTPALTGNVRLSEVIDEQGAVMTYGQVAARCGVTPQSVKKRLAVWRRKGKTRVPIQDLL